MTDADVDGAHIRTLLLTFFFRNMPQIIGNGHLYIAQPPLYKASRGRSSKWLYSEAELDEWTANRLYGKIRITSDVDSALELKSSKIGRVLTPLRDYIDSLEVARVLNIPEAVIDKLVTDPELASLDFRPERPSVPEVSVETAQPSLFDDETSNENASSQETPDSSQVDEVEPEILPDPTYDIDGYVLTKDIYQNPAVQRLRTIYPIIQQLVEAGTLNIEKGDDVVATNVAWSDLPSTLDNNSDRSGVNVQRYKGLGEMNPDQLWETTMDPNERVMLRVTADDAMAADDMFRTLMGDDVEPRRNFIRANALEVKNLDV